MGTFLLSPNPVVPGATVNFSGTGWPAKTRLRIYVNGTNQASLRVSREGTFGPDGFLASTLEGTYTVELKQYINGTYQTVLPATNLVVKKSSVPTASFAYTKNNLAVTFVDTSIGLPTAWLWTFGDGSSAPYENVSHTYTASGSYTVTLKVTNSVGSTTASQVVSVSAPIVLPFAGFAATDLVVSAGGVVNVPAGVYKERFTLKTPGVRWTLATGAEIDLSGFSIAIQDAGWAAHGDDIIIDGGRTHGSSASGWRMEGARFQLLNHETDHCLQQAYVGHSTGGALIKGGSIHDCNYTGGFYAGGEQGAGKSIAPGLVFDGVHLYNIGKVGGNDTAGQGFWWDSVRLASNVAPATYGQGWNAEVKNCRIENVFYAGIMFEIGVGGKFHDNVIVRCGSTPSGGGFWGSGILISAGLDVDMYGNIFYANQSHMRVVAWVRSDAPRSSVNGPQLDTINVKFHDNYLLDATLHQFSYDSTDAGMRSRMFLPASGNAAWGNKFHGKLAVRWNSQILDTIAKIDTIPGGGGNTVLTDTERNTVLTQYNIAP